MAQTAARKRALKNVRARMLNLEKKGFHFNIDLGSMRTQDINRLTQQKLIDRYGYLKSPVNPAKVYTINYAEYKAYQSNVRKANRNKAKMQGVKSTKNVFEPFSKKITATSKDAFDKVNEAIKNAGTAEALNKRRDTLYHNFIDPLKEYADNNEPVAWLLKQISKFSRDEIVARLSQDLAARGDMAINNLFALYYMPILSSTQMYHIYDVFGFTWPDSFNSWEPEAEAEEFWDE